MRVIGYRRVSTEEQAHSGLGLDAQTARIEDAASRHGWDVEWKQDLGMSGKVINPGLREALELLRTKQADALVVAKMDRVARSVLNAADIMATARAQGWSIIILDLGMDLATPSGRAMFNMLATFAELERDMTSTRTREALAAKKARGEHAGRPSAVPPGVRRRIVLSREAGASFGRIARELTTEGILSPTGRAEWSETTVRRTYNRAVA